jgi:hypothetical protein
MRRETVRVLSAGRSACTPTVSHSLAPSGSLKGLLRVATPAVCSKKKRVCGRPQKAAAIASPELVSKLG